MTHKLHRDCAARADPSAWRIGRHGTGALWHQGRSIRYSLAHTTPGAPARRSDGDGGRQAHLNDGLKEVDPQEDHADGLEQLMEA